MVKAASAAHKASACARKRRSQNWPRWQGADGGTDDRAGIEAVSGEWLFGLALRAVGGAMMIGAGELFEVLLHRAGEWI